MKPSQWSQIRPSFPGGEKADQAEGELPDRVDPEQHSDLLSKFGIDPQELLSGGLGGVAGKLGL